MYNKDNSKAYAIHTIHWSGVWIYKMFKPKVTLIHLFRKKKISFLKSSRNQYFDGQPAAQIITSQYHQIGYVVQNRKR